MFDCLPYAPDVELVDEFDLDVGDGVGSDFLAFIGWACPLGFGEVVGEVVDEFEDLVGIIFDVPQFGHAVVFDLVVSDPVLAFFGAGFGAASVVGRVHPLVPFGGCSWLVGVLFVFHVCPHAGRAVLGCFTG